MEKHIYNEQTGISYTLQGDYYLPEEWVGRMNNIRSRATEAVNYDLIFN